MGVMGTSREGEGSSDPFFKSRAGTGGTPKFHETKFGENENIKIKNQLSIQMLQKW